MTVCLSEPGEIHFRCDPSAEGVPETFTATEKELCVKFEIPATVQGLVATSSGAIDVVIV